MCHMHHSPPCLRHLLLPMIQQQFLHPRPCRPQGPLVVNDEDDDAWIVSANESTAYIWMWKVISIGGSRAPWVTIELRIFLETEPLKLQLSGLQHLRRQDGYRLIDLLQNLIMINAPYSIILLWSHDLWTWLILHFVTLMHLKNVMRNLSVA